MYEFSPPEGSCHQYLVKAKSMEDAMAKFEKWQSENLEEDNRWPPDDTRDKNNWCETEQIHLIE